MYFRKLNYLFILLAAYLIHIPLISIIAWWLYSRQAHTPLKLFFWVGLLLKMLASTALGLIYAYIYHYNSDSFAYFNDAVVLSKVAWQNPPDYFNILLHNMFPSGNVLESLGLWSQPRAFFMAKILSVVTFLSFNNYWVSGWYLSLFSFWGMWKLANTLASLLPATRIAASMAFLLFPSVVFWSAGVMKESIVMGCIGGSISIVLSYLFRLNPGQTVLSKIVSAIFFIISLLVLWQLKYYYLGALLPVCAAYMLTVFFNQKIYPAASPLLNIAALFVFFTLILLLATRLHPNLYIANFLTMLVDNHQLIYAASSQENVIHFSQLQASVSSLLANFPLALISGLYRPFIWEAHTVFQWITGLENGVLVILSLYALRPQNIARLPRQPRYYLLILSALLYIVFLAVLMAFASPNFGTLVRYKIGFLPFFVYLLLCNTVPDSLLFRNYPATEKADNI